MECTKHSPDVKHNSSTRDSNTDDDAVNALLFLHNQSFDASTSKSNNNNNTTTAAANADIMIQKETKDDNNDRNDDQRYNFNNKRSSSNHNNDNDNNNIMKSSYPVGTTTTDTNIDTENDNPNNQTSSSSSSIVPQCNHHNKSNHNDDVTNDVSIMTTLSHNSSLPIITSTTTDTTQNTTTVTTTSTTDDDNNKKNGYDIQLKQIKDVATLVQKLKIELYLEAMKVHHCTNNNKSGHDDNIVECKFTEYWNAFSRYMTGFTNNNNNNNNNHNRSNCNSTMNGIEAMLNKFLITKSLKKKHNKIVKALMKQCLYNNVLYSRVQCHIPMKWEQHIRKIHKRKWLHDIEEDGEEESQDNLVVNDLLRFDDDCCINNKDTKSLLFVKNDEENIISDHQTENDHQDKEIEKQISSRLPGIVEMDYTSRTTLRSTGYSLSSDALWLVTVAVRECISKFLQNYMNTVNSGEALMIDDCSKQSNKKKRKIDVFDLISSLDCMQTDTGPFSSRMVWERCISEIDQHALHNVMRSNLSATKNIEEITNLIVMTSNKKRKVELVEQRRSSIGKGKDLAAMVVRHQLDGTKKDAADLNSMPSSTVSVKEVSQTSSCNESPVQNADGTTESMTNTAENVIPTISPSQDIIVSNIQSTKGESSI